MENAVKSIFRQREVEGEYKRVEVFQVYGDNFNYYYNLSASDNVISDNIIGEYDIAIPLLEPGETFYLHDIKECVVRDRRMRGSDGSITYFVKDKIIETENTKKSYEKCINREFEELKEKFEDYKREYKYKHRFFNF